MKKETQATGFVLEYADDRAGRETRGTIRVPVSGLYGPTQLSEAVSSVTLKLDSGSALSATPTNGTWEYVDGGLKGLNVPEDGATIPLL